MKTRSQNNDIRPLRLGLVFICLFMGMNCKNIVKNGVLPTDSPIEGTIRISVDETYRPVLEEEIKVFEASYPGTHIIAEYKSEADCFRDLYQDSAKRLIVVTRPLNSRERVYFTDSLGFAPASDKVASDAIAVVLNKNSDDSLFTFERLQSILTGKDPLRRSVVFDGLNATSTVRYAIDSLLHGGSFDTGIVKAVKNSREVLDYIATDKNAIGFVGISWIGNPEDTSQVRQMRKLKFGFIRCTPCTDSPYIMPTQFGIMSRRYPLVRGLYYILKESYIGLGSGFTGFLKYERGQLIFRRAYLGEVMDFGIRQVKINQQLPKDLK